MGSPSRARTYDLGGYGKLTVLRRSATGITGLRARLTRRYRDHPRGSWVAVAYASARAANGRAAPESREKEKRAESRRGGKGKDARAKRRRAPELRRLRTGRGYSFPVRGRHRFTNDYGAPRQHTGTHVGNDIFARAGAPVVAVTSGRLFRVGTRRVPGNRLWLKGPRGDTFFYAHLSAFAQEARNGLEVKAGDVVGFVGSTGDAEQTPPHLHFEVHPKGGDPVNPYPFLRAWEKRRDVPSAAWLERYGGDAAARPGSLVVLHDFLEP